MNQLNTKNIAINAGHEPNSDPLRAGNGYDSGTSTIANERQPLIYVGNLLSIPRGNHLGAISEHALNQDITLRLKEILEKNGGLVHLIREEDFDLANNNRVTNLTRRVKIANYSKAEVLLDIHSNGNPLHPEYNGFSVIVDNTNPNSERYNRSMLLAMLLSEEFSKLTFSGEKIRVRDINQRSDLILIRETIMPAVLIECGYMTNKKDMDLLAKPEYRHEIAQFLANSLGKYFTKN